MLMVGTPVHYVSRGSMDGKYEPTCRAATVTELGYIEDHVSLGVLNPTGLFFDAAVAYDEDKTPGTWHPLDQCENEETK